MASYLLPDGRTVSDSMAFTLVGIQYPSNWLLLSTEQDRSQRNITGPLPEPPWYDQQFYLGFDADGHLIPKDHSGLVSLYSGYCRLNANALLQETDWMVIRESDNGIAVPANVKTWRENIRLACGSKISILKGTLDTDDLAAYITHGDYPVWPSDSPAPVESVAIDGLELAFNGGATGGAII
jgi:hypothetical protein